MTMKTDTLLSLFFGLAMSLPAIALGQSVVLKQGSLPQARVNIKIMDESGGPLSGVAVRLVFSKPTDHTATVYEEGLTDADGKFSAQGYTGSSLGSGCQKDGYYRGSASIPNFTERKGNQWQPWDATYTSILRRIEKPVPVYARQVFPKVPELAACRT